MSCKERVTVSGQAIDWLKEHYPALCIKAGLCERVGGRLYTKTLSCQAPLPAHEIVTMYDESPTCDGDMIAFARAKCSCAAPVAAAVAPGLRQRIEQLIEQHGSLRAAARVLMVDVGYLSRLASGEKDDPGEDLLRRMKLRRVVSYESTAKQAAKPEPEPGEVCHCPCCQKGIDAPHRYHWEQRPMPEPAQRLTQETIYRLWDGHTPNWPAGVLLREFEDIARVIESAVRSQAGDAQDAARLDWLERQDLSDVAMIRQTNGVVGINVGTGPCYGKTLRAAIDAAIKEQTK